MSVAIQENTNEIESKVELIKRLYCKGASNDELELFIHACKRTGLDPFMKQIYAIKLGGQMTIQTGIDGLRLVAERTSNYSPGRESTFAYDANGLLVSATSYIKKRTSDGTWHEVAATAYLDEYNAKQGLWNKMPRAMLSKCAEALALRKAFPAEMSGLYTKDEMEQADARQEPLQPAIKEDVLISKEQAKEITDKLKLINNQEYREKLENHCFENYEAASFDEITQNQYIEVMKSINRQLKMMEVA